MSTFAGKHLVFSVDLKNLSEEKERRTVNIHLTAKVTYYTGRPGAEITDQRLQVVLQPDEGNRYKGKPVCD